MWIGVQMGNHLRVVQGIVLFIFNQNSGGVWALKNTLTDAHAKTVRRVSWNPTLGSSGFAASSFDGSVSIWESSPSDPSGWICAATLEGHENEVKGVAWDSTGKMIATSGRDKSVWVWTHETGEFECMSVLRGHAQDVKSVAWHPSLPVLFSCSYDNTIREWQAAGDDWKCTAKLDTAHSSTIWDISLDATGNRLASCSDDSTIVIWRRNVPYANGGDTADAPAWVADKSIREKHQGRPIYGVAWSHAPRGLIVAAGGDNSVRVFREMVGKAGSDASKATAEFEEIASVLNAHEADVNCVRWCPTVPEIFASCGDDGLVKIWKVAFDS